MSRNPLVRPQSDRLLGGVAAGLARHLDVPVSTVRLVLAVAGVLGGAGVIFYAWLWATVPAEEAPDAPIRSVLTRPADVPHPGRQGQSRQGQSTAASGATPLARSARTRWPIAELTLGAALLITGAALVIMQFGVDLPLERLLSGMAVLAGVGLTWWQIADRDRPERSQMPRVLAALTLVAVGVLMFFITSRQPSAWTVIAAAIAVLAGVALAIAPWLLRINRELADERAARARESERAAIAAHLHDSVLQTLALIQQRSEPGSDVDRLARGQERELREWLFRTADGGAASPRVSLETELRDHAARLEASHAVRFELIAVGSSPAEGSRDASALTVPEALAAAARESMLNAARHAGGTVTVYIELTPSLASVDILDRGPGVDVSAIQEGRMGIRESILGRMDRAGGQAQIKAGPHGRGTAVRLSIPLEAPSRPGGDPREDPS